MVSLTMVSFKTVEYVSMLTLAVVVFVCFCFVFTEIATNVSQYKNKEQNNACYIQHTKGPCRGNTS